MQHFDSYLDEGSPLEKLQNVTAIAKDLALICDQADNNHIVANNFGGLVSLIALRLMQIHKEMEMQDSTVEEGKQ